MSQFEDKNYVPYIIFESAQSRLDRVNRRSWIVTIILIVLLFATNSAWLYYEKQFDVVTETTTVTQTNSDGSNNFIGNDGEISNGNTDSNEK